MLTQSEDEDGQSFLQETDDALEEFLGKCYLRLLQR